MGREYVFKDHQAKLSETAAGMRMDDGQVFRILPPALWPDKIQRLALTDPIAAAHGMLDGGDEAYAAYEAAGGNAGMIGHFIELEYGVAAPESQASSDS